MTVRPNHQLDQRVLSTKILLNCNAGRVEILIHLLTTVYFIVCCIAGVIFPLHPLTCTNRLTNVNLAVDDGNH